MFLLHSRMVSQFLNLSFFAEADYPSSEQPLAVSDSFKRNLKATLHC